jgi:hypothetical protein
MLWRLTRGCLSHCANILVPCAVLHLLSSPNTDMFLFDPPIPVGSGITERFQIST